MPKPTKDAQKTPGKTATVRKRPIARQTNVTSGSGGVFRRGVPSINEVDEAVSATEGTYANAYPKDRATGRTFTPLLQNAKYSNPRGSTATRTERSTRRDPFLDGFNSGTTAVTRKRRK